MNTFTQTFLPRIKAVVSQEAWYKSKIILQHFSNISENVKSDSEQQIVNNDQEQPASSLENSFKAFEIRHDDSFKHLEVKQNIKEPLLNSYETSDDESFRNIDIKSAINKLGKGVTGNWNISRKNFFQDDNLKGFDPILPKALDECVEDVSHIGPFVKPTVNFASVANKSKMVQELCKLGVDFFKIEKCPNNAKYLMGLDFDQDIKPVIQFLNDCSVDPAEFGKIITKNPKIFSQDLEDLKTRIRYLRAHAFNREMIARILTVNPLWLMFNTRQIDDRLGYFQYEFKMKGAHIRKLAVKSPELITYSMKVIRENTFAVKEEMGFDADQTRSILLNRPVLWMLNRGRIVSCFDYVYNTMKIPHELIVKQPDILLHRRRRVQSRHMFLVELNKAQYDPTLPNYVSLKNVVEGNDAEFCENVAKCSVETYNLFLKSL